MDNETAVAILWGFEPAFPDLTTPEGEELSFRLLQVFSDLPQKRAVLDAFREHASRSIRTAKQMALSKWMLEESNTPLDRIKRVLGEPEVRWQVEYLIDLLTESTNDRRTS